jgi:hypothetical protein
LFEIHGECLKLCKNEKDKRKDKVVFNSLISEHQTFKAELEEWFACAPVASVRKVGFRSADSASQVSRGSSRSSQLSMAKAAEQTRKAEFLAHARALKAKRKLEEAKLQLQMDEEEFDIETEIQISDARAKVLEELEQSELRDQELLKPLVETSSASGVKTHVKFIVPGDTREEEIVSTLNPSAHLFAPLVQSTPVTPMSSTSNMYNKSSDMGLGSVAREFRKPTVEISKFNGNVMDYTQFLRQFEARIGVNTDSYEEKLTYLLQFTTGEAHEIAAAYSHFKNAESGYTAALQEFDERYGDSNEIAHAYIKRALDWPLVKPMIRFLARKLCWPSLAIIVSASHPSLPKEVWPPMLPVRLSPLVVHVVVMVVVTLLVLQTVRPPILPILCQAFPASFVTNLTIVWSIARCSEVSHCLTGFHF